MLKIVSFMLSAVTAVGMVFGDFSFTSAEAAEKETKLIALTFDDGPNTTTTNDVLDILEEYEAYYDEVWGSVPLEDKMVKKEDPEAEQEGTEE